MSFIDFLCTLGSRYLYQYRYRNRLTCHDSPSKLTYYPYRLTYPYFPSRPQVWCTVLIKSFVFRIRHFGSRSKFGQKPEERSVFRHSQPPHHRQDARRRKGKHCVKGLPRNARESFFKIISNMTCKTACSKYIGGQVLLKQYVNYNRQPKTINSNGNLYSHILNHLVFKYIYGGDEMYNSSEA